MTDVVTEAVTAIVAPVKTIEERLAALEATALPSGIVHPLSAIEDLAAAVKTKIAADEKAALADALAVFKGKITTTVKYSSAGAGGAIAYAVIHHFFLPFLW